MAINFPSSPVDGQIHTANGTTWRYNASRAVWDSSEPGSVPGHTHTIIDQINGVIATPVDRDYLILLNVPVAMTIRKVTTKSTSGTCTATWKVNTTALGGTANSVSTSENAQTHTSANVLSVGDDLNLTVSANASCVDLSFCVEFSRTI